MRRINIFALQSPLNAVQTALTSTPRVVQLSPRDREVFQTLHRLALERSAAQHGLHRLPSFEVISLPAELLQAHLELATGTLYKSLDRLEEAGLIARAALFGTLRGQSVKAGTLFSVVLNPARDHTARIPYGQFKVHRRNLDRDARAGNTAWAELQKHRATQGESQIVPASETALSIPPGTSSGLGFHILKKWAVIPRAATTPVILTLTRAAQPFDLYAIHDVMLTRLEGRAALVDEWARGLAMMLGDKSLDVWRWLGWNLTRAKEQGQDYLNFVCDAISRARADHSEGFARSAGALLISRLKAAGIWDALKLIPQTRVGPRPV